MAKYIDSLQRGLDAARNAERNRKEVDEVFDELNQQLGIATQNRVAIRRVQYNAPIDLTKAIDSSLSAFFARDKFWALAAVFLPSSKVESTQLAKWVQDNNGYPCRLSFGANSYSCEDRPALEEVLEILLADATVGEAIYKYMNIPLPETSE